MQHDLRHKILKVSFELSTLCNYATFHKKCPLHEKKEHDILPAKAIYGVVQELAALDYRGMFLFNVYNEPLIDPRLFLFTRFIKDSCPEATIFIITNGYYMDQNLVDELPQYGVDMIALSLYSKKEKERLARLRYPVAVRFWDYMANPQDNRLDFYSSQSKPVSNAPCARGAPLEEITITAQGDVILCCLDWKRSVVFGNILQECLVDIIAKPEFITAYNSLQCGQRELSICQACEQCHAGRNSVRL